MALDAKTMAQLQSVSDLIVNYGVPAVLEIVTKIGSKPNPTVEDFEALGENINKDVDSFFEDDPKGGTDGGTAGGPE